MCCGAPRSTRAGPGATPSSAPSTWWPRATSRVTDDAARAQKALDDIRPFVALYAGGMGARGHNFYNDVVRGYGWENEARLIQDLYLDGKKEAAAGAVPTKMLEAMALVGPRGQVAERLAVFAAAGVHRHRT